MANHKSALKRARQNEKRRQRNKSLKSAVKTFEKKVYAAKDAGDENLQEILAHAQSLIDKAAQKKVLHKNTASRKISNITRYVNP